jgi:hypothetical protein
LFGNTQEEKKKKAGASFENKSQIIDCIQPQPSIRLHEVIAHSPYTKTSEKNMGHLYGVIKL